MVDLLKKGYTTHYVNLWSKSLDETLKKAGVEEEGVRKISNECIDLSLELPEIQENTLQVLKSYNLGKKLAEINKNFLDRVRNNAPTEVKDILENPTLIEVINKELDKKIVAEEDTRTTILLIAFGGRLVANAEPPSSNLMVNDESGAGKDYITKRVLEIVPEKDTIVRKRISEKVFTYWKNALKEPSWTWDGKTFYNEDISNSVLNSDVFKVMSSSDGDNTTTIINTKLNAEEILVRGKPAMIITIAMANPKQELLRRFPIVNLNTSEDQTKEILKRKAEFHKKGIKPVYDERIKNALGFLKRVKVRVDFADKLVTLLSTKNIIIRTHFDRLIDYIKFSTAIHQYQRSKDKEGYILAEEQDYEYARVALIKTTSNSFSISLPLNHRKVLEIIKEMPDLNHSVTDLEPKITFISDRMLRKILDDLTRDGFLQKDKEDRENSKKPVMVYSYLGDFKINIPDWKELQNNSSVSNDTNVSINSSVSTEGLISGLSRTIETLETNEQKNRG